MWTTSVLLDLSHLVERAPGPRSSSLPWGRLSRTPELLAETTVVPCPSWPTQAADQGAGPAPPLFPRNAGASATGTEGDNINVLQPSVRADGWKGSWNIQYSWCLAEVKLSESFWKSTAGAPNLSFLLKVIFNVSSQTWSDNFLLIYLEC